jgi:hypothetical protein
LRSATLSTRRDSIDLNHRATQEVRMIARIWRGATRAEDAEAYVAYLEETDSRSTARRPATRVRGCCGAGWVTAPSS